MDKLSVFIRILGLLNFFVLSWLLLLGIVPIDFASGFMWMLFLLIGLWPVPKEKEEKEVQHEDTVQG
jgi:hypothetical protein